MANGIYDVAFPSGSDFGYHDCLIDPNDIHHFDFCHAHVFDDVDGKAGACFDDFTDNDLVYSPTLPFLSLDDFGLDS